MLRLADDLTISMTGDVVRMERADAPPLILQAEVERVRLLASLLRTPRSAEWLTAMLDRECPDSDARDLLSRLLLAGMLIEWTSVERIVDLHRRTTTGPLAADDGPQDMERARREYSMEGAVRLPAPGNVAMPLASALASRRTTREFTGEAVSLQTLATLLSGAVGGGADGRVRQPAVVGGPPAGRTYPSGGALYPIEMALYAHNVEDLTPAFYAYQPLPHRLRWRAGPVSTSELSALLNDHPVDRANFVLLLHADLASAALVRYGEKSYRLLLLEAGHLAQNVLLMAAALRLATLPLCGFADDALALAAGLSIPTEAVVYALMIGQPLTT